MSAQRSVPTNNSSEAAAQRPYRVLVADDELINREILLQMLSAKGYDAVSVVDGVEVLQKLETESFDLVLLDVVMPNMDGFECLRRIRKRYSISQLPVIIVTAESNRNRIVEAFRDGVNDYVTKPIDRDVTLARIATHTQLRRSLLALHCSEERYALAARGANDGLWDWDVSTGEVFYSPRWAEMLGYTEAEVGCSPDEWFSRIHPADADRFAVVTSRSLSGTDENLHCELRLMHRDGGYRWMLCRGAYVRNEDGQICRMAGSLTDITEGKIGDPLTGLPNRLLFIDRLERAAERFQRLGHSYFAVMFLDLDNFKLINDSLGHQAGDRVLIAVAQRLQDCLRASDKICRMENSATIARHAGDEFTILLEGLASPHDVQPIADRILQSISQPLQLENQEVLPSLSIGWAIGDLNTRNVEDLLREADTAMYQAKAEGRNRSRQFEPGMQVRAKQRLEMEKDLRHGLANQEFFLNYQPIVSLSNQRVFGFEALVRWQHPTRGLVSPFDFIPTAEEIGLIAPLGWWITEEACKQAATWSAQSPGQRLMMTINCSVHQLYEPNFLERFRSVIERTVVNPSQICLEVTEHTLMDRPDVICPIIGGLREMGISIGIDDFGTGYSSLAYLHRLPLDLLKVDRSFVSSMLSSRENQEIVRTILGLGRSLRLKTVAEGVEQDAQRIMLKELGCELAQGYLWSPPLSASAATQFFSQQSSRQSWAPSVVIEPTPTCQSPAPI